MDKNIKIFVSVLVLLVVAVALLAILRTSPPPASAGEYDELAQCLGEKGAVFYGAFWCSVCKSQKEMFGSSAKLLPYTECSTPDGRGQTAECREKGIPSYPTWEFADGSRLTGAIPIPELAEKTACALPAAPATPE